MTKEYFKKRFENTDEALEFSDICYRKAKFYKQLYMLTGLEWAKKKNQYYVDKGTQVCIANLAMISVDLAMLDKIIKRGE